MKQLNIPQKEKRLILRFKNELKDLLGENLVSIQLFGSKARGDWHKDSDIDILVVVRRKNSSVEDKIYELVFSLLLETDIYLSVKLFSSEEFHKLNALPTVFMQSLKKGTIKV